MNYLLYRGMHEATRLTRAGKLTEATAFLRRLIGGGRASPGTSGTERETAQRPKLPAPLIIDMEPSEAVAKESRPSPQAATLPEGAQFLSASFSNPAGTRPYKLYIPSGYDGQAVPLIVMLHGCTQSPDDFAAGTGMNAAAEEETCLVAYPAQTKAANMSKCWNWFNAGDQRRDQGEPSLIAGITREIMQRYSVDPRRVYVAGLSAGGAAAAIMGNAYPDLYAAIGVHSGLACGAARDVPSAFAAMRRGGAGGVRRASEGSDASKGRRVVPAIVFHGDRDTTVHPRNGDEIVAQSARATSLAMRVEEGRVIGGHAYSRSLYADANGETLLEQWLIRGAGHAWSGGSSAGTYTDPRGPDSTKEMLRFFLDHPRPAEA
jgi:poly(hydroxyalkanoate) depolymerase family esterase